MLRVKRSRSLIAGIVALGCARPVNVRLSTAGGSPATAHLRLLTGGEPPIPDQCPIPCTVRLAPGTTQDVIIEAPGHYPAHFQLTHQAATAAKGAQGGDGPQLVVPLKERRAAPVPSGAVGSAPVGVPPSLAVPATATPAGSHAAVEERLKNLNELRRHGLISEKEYTERRARILDETLGE